MVDLFFVYKHDVRFPSCANVRDAPYCIEDVTADRAVVRSDSNLDCVVIDDFYFFTLRVWKRVVKRVS